MPIRSTFALSMLLLGSFTATAAELVKVNEPVHPSYSIGLEPNHGSIRYSVDSSLEPTCLLRSEQASYIQMEAFTSEDLQILVSQQLTINVKIPTDLPDYTIQNRIRTQ